MEPWPLIGVHGRNKLKYKGWTTVTEELGHNPDHTSGGDYTGIVQWDRIAIARLNNGYGDAGTIPHSDYYPGFAQRVRNWVEASKGCKIWVIGNEMNHRQERPKGQPITPDLYARCFNWCRAEIRSIPGHEQDLVLLAAIGPWNADTTYPGNEEGDWLVYFRDLQRAVDDLDGFALHVYARTQTPAGVRSRTFMQPPFQTHHYGFGILEDWMDAILPQYRDRPSFITECNAYGPWVNVNTGFCGAVLLAVHGWNVGHPDRAPIRSVCFYRWKHDRWSFENLGEVHKDFYRAADLGLTAPIIDAPPEETWTMTVRIEATSSLGQRRVWEGTLAESGQ